MSADRFSLQSRSESMILLLECKTAVIDCGPKTAAQNGPGAEAMRQTPQKHACFLSHLVCGHSRTGFCRRVNCLADIGLTSTASFAQKKVTPTRCNRHLSNWDTLISAVDLQARLFCFRSKEQFSTSGGDLRCALNCLNHCAICRDTCAYFELWVSDDCPMLLCANGETDGRQVACCILNEKSDKIFYRDSLAFPAFSNASFFRIVDSVDWE